MTSFYGYTVRTTTKEDWPLAAGWMAAQLKTGNFDRIHTAALFWLQQGSGVESFLVMQGDLPLGFFQTQHVGRGDQVRLLFQASPSASRKKILRAITKLVPLIEKGLALRGVRAIFFTSHSLAMVAFMEKLGYQLQPYLDGGADGVVMAKGIGATAMPSAEDLDRMAEEQKIRELTA